jgi:hypothetical protein
MSALACAQCSLPVRSVKGDVIEDDPAFHPQPDGCTVLEDFVLCGACSESGEPHFQRKLALDECGCTIDTHSATDGFVTHKTPCVFHDTDAGTLDYYAAAVEAMAEATSREPVRVVSPEGKYQIQFRREPDSA